jgi:hypothetical protein
MCDSDYTALVIEGSAEADHLAEAWQKIHQEYIALLGNSQDNYLLTLMMEVNRLYFRHLSITEAVKLLRAHRFDELVMMLKKEGFNYPFNPNDPEEYRKDLNKVTNRAKSLLVELEQKKKQLELLQQNQSTGKIDREYFDKILITLSQHMGFKLEKDKTTVTEYIYTLKDYISHCERLKAKDVRGSHK